MKLTELLRIIDKENKDGYVNVDEWRWPDIDHLISMGFEFVDDYRLKTTKNPEITIYQKMEKNDKNNSVNNFYVEEKDAPLKRFQTFNDVIDYFDKYSQPEIDKNK